MRLWSLHPKYLDPQGLVALWREALLAQAVLRGKTRGYRHHPQLDRFRAQRAPRSAINAYLEAVHAESQRRNYRFDHSKVGPVRTHNPTPVSTEQIRFEWQHLLEKLSRRSPALYRYWRGSSPTPLPHPSFRVQAGPLELWERP